MITETKICGWCFIEKPVSEFHKRKKNGKVSLRLECKICYRGKKMKTYHENKIENKEKMRLNRIKYVEKRRIYDRNREVEMKSILKERRAIRYKLNAEIIKQRRKEYYYNNRDKVIKLNSAYIEKNLRMDMFEKVRNFVVQKDGLFYFDESKRESIPKKILT